MASLARGPSPGAREAIDLVATGFEPLPGFDGPADDPLDWPGYVAVRARASANSGEQEAVLCGTARIGGRPGVVISFDFRYIGGSVGTRAGAMICAARPPRCAPSRAPAR